MVSSRFFESEPNEIYSHVSEKGQKAGFLRQKYQESQYRGKRKGRKKERGGRKEEKRKKQWLHSSVYNGYFGEFLAEKNCLTEEVYLVETFSNIQLDIK